MTKALQKLLHTLKDVKKWHKDNHLAAFTKVQSKSLDTLYIMLVYVGSAHIQLLKRDPEIK